MTDAVAKAAGVPVADVRRAAMLAGDLPSVAEVAMREGADGLARFRLTPLRADRPDARADGRRRRGRSRATGVHVRRVEARRRTDPGPSRGRRHRDLHAQPRRHHRSRARDRRCDPRARRLGDRARRRGDRASRRRPPAAVSGDDEPLRHEGGRGGCDCRSPSFFFDCLHVDGDDLIDLPARERLDVLDARLPTGAHRSPPRDERCGGSAGVPRRRARARPRGRHGQVARRAVRGRTPRSRLAEGEAGAHARPRRARRRVGARSADGQALEPPSRRARPGERRLRDAREDVQGHDGRDARLADGAPARSRRRAREGHVVHVRPELVVEVAFDGVQTSSRYPGGMALRFARVKGYRPDKSPSEADTIDTVRAIHARAE